MHPIFYSWDSQPYQIRYMWAILPYALRKEYTLYEPNKLQGLNIPLTQRKVSNSSTIAKVFTLPVLVVLTLILIG